MRRILCLHMPHFAIERARHDGAWADSPAQPVALTRTTGGTHWIATVCPRAARRGIYAGLTLGQAQALAPQLHVGVHEPRRDRAALQRLACWALRFSPQVEPVEPDTLLLDITGCERLFGGEERLARQARHGLAQQGFSARAAIADTLGAAWALAVAHLEPLCIAPRNHTSAWLAPLPPSALRIPHQTAEQLDALGIRTIGDLLMVPRVSWPARFGFELVRRVQQALGEIAEPITSHQPAQLPTQRRLFEYPVCDTQAIQHATATLLDALFAHVCQIDHAVRQLDCVLHFEEQPPRVRTVRLTRAARTATHVAPLLTQRLETVDVSAGVISITLIAREITRFRGRQAHLFEPHDPGDEEALSTLLDRLANRLGTRALLQAELVADHQPEHTFRYRYIADGTASPPIDAPATPPNPRPLRLLPRPIRIRAIALLPEGPPTWLAWSGQEHPVTYASGPERIETGWWRGPDVRRDYYRVTVASGLQFWVFRDRDDHGWYMHGFYA